MLTHGVLVMSVDLEDRTVYGVDEFEVGRLLGSMESDIKTILRKLNKLDEKIEEVEERVDALHHDDDHIRCESEPNQLLQIVSSAGVFHVGDNDTNMSFTTGDVKDSIIQQGNVSGDAKVSNDTTNVEKIEADQAILKNDGEVKK